MIKVRLFIYYNLLILAILSSGCSSEEPQVEPEGKYKNGVFVVNQGAFGSGTGTLTFYDGDTILEQKVFQMNNAGMTLGNVAQSMIKVDDQLFIAINNAGKFVIIDAESAKFLNSVSGVDQPRYFYEWDNQFLYLSEWGISGLDGRIHKINRLDGAIVNSTFVGGGPEKMTIIDNSLYICKSGGYGNDSLLLKYDLLTDEIVDSYVIGDNPVDIVQDKIGTLWILCSGSFDFTNPMNNTPGRLVQFDEGAILNSWELENGVGNLAHDQGAEILYFTAGNKILKFDMNTATQPELLYNGSFYALATEPFTGNVYAADAKDFVSNGEIIVIDPDGQKINSFPAGLIPGQIYFVN